MRKLLLACAFAATGSAQEAASGFDLRATIGVAAVHAQETAGSTELDEDPPIRAGARATFYPAWKLNKHWTLFGAIQVHTLPYFLEEFAAGAYGGAKADVLQANLSYSRVWGKRSLTVRAGQLSSAFGSFLLRYDPTDNPLYGMPLMYGYYYKSVTNLGLMGVQADATLGPVDLRAQFVNSSPANRRSVFDHDQYGNWAGGIGYSIQPGFRVGVSAYRGPYLHRQYRFYFPGEAAPRELPGSGYGIDVQWGKGPWNVWGELQRFQRAYRAVPTFNQHSGYAEIRRVLHPRWYVATRAEYMRASIGPYGESYEMAAGFRPNRHQLVKFDYVVRRGPMAQGSFGNAAIIELVTSAHLISVGRD